MPSDWAGLLFSAPQAPIREAVPAFIETLVGLVEAMPAFNETLVGLVEAMAGFFLIAKLSFVPS